MNFIDIKMHGTIYIYIYIYIKPQINSLCILSFYYKIRNNLLGAILPAVGRFSLYKRKLSRLTAGAQPRTSCSSLFTQLEILPVPCLHILSLMKCIIDNQDIFQINSSIHNINTRNKHIFTA